MIDDVAEIGLKKRISPYDLMDEVLTVGEPTMYWRLDFKIKNEYVKAVCIDLITRKKLNLEITPEFIRIYMPEGLCKYTVRRLFENIRKYCDPEAICVLKTEEW